MPKVFRKTQQHNISEAKASNAEFIDLRFINSWPGFLHIIQTDIRLIANTGKQFRYFFKRNVFVLKYNYGFFPCKIYFTGNDVLI
jgi:hypothetical protein